LLILGSVAHILTVFEIVPLSMRKQVLEEKIVSNFFFVTFAKDTEWNCVPLWNMRNETV
jgi:hypothetical protein